MSGMIDLSGIAARAYTPGAKPANPGATASETAENKKPVRSPVADRRLAPAFSIELSLAAQKLLEGVDLQAPAKAGNVESSQSPETSTSHNLFSEGVGRREAPLETEQRDVALGSRLNIQI